MITDMSYACGGVHDGRQQVESIVDVRDCVQQNSYIYSRHCANKKRSPARDERQRDGLRPLEATFYHKILSYISRRIRRVVAPWQPDIVVARTM